MMKRILAAAVCTALLSGCSPRNDEQIRVLTEIRNQLEQTNKQLESVNKKIAVLETQVKTMRRNNVGQPFQAFRADPAALVKIKLPEKPTRKQVIEYIQKIQAASANQNSFSDSDPQVGMYAKIGPGYLDVVLPFLKVPQGSSHLRYALPQLVGKSDKDLVLKNLPQYPQLISSVLAYGWFPDARKQIIEMMKNSRNFYEFGKVTPLMISTPEDQAALVQIFQSNPSAGSLAALIETFPDVDFGKVAETAWKKNRFNQNTWELLPFAVFAVKNGVKDAFPMLFSRALSQPANSRIHIPGYMGTSVPFLINELLNRDTALKDTFEWYNKNADRLVFDSRKKQYVLSAAAK